MKTNLIHIFIVALIASVFGGGAVAVFTPTPEVDWSEVIEQAAEALGGVTNYDALTLDDGGLIITNGTLTVSATSTLTGQVVHQSVTVRRQTQAFDTATTTVCSLQAPSATSTLVSGAATFDVSSTTATTVTVARATSAFATTTLIRTEAIGADAQETIPFASSTLAAAGTEVVTKLAEVARIFGPNEWLVVGVQGNVGTFSPTGDCWATWTTAN